MLFVNVNSVYVAVVDRSDWVKHKAECFVWPRLDFGMELPDGKLRSFLFFIFHLLLPCACVCEG